MDGFSKVVQLVPELLGVEAVYLYLAFLKRVFSLIWDSHKGSHFSSNPTLSNSLHQTRCTEYVIANLHG